MALFDIPDDCQNIVMVAIAVVAVLVIYLLHTRKNKGQNSEKKVQFKDEKKQVSNNTNGSKIVMYGKDSCPWCKRQKTELGDSWEKVHYINCKDNQQACEENKIAALPTWVINGERSEGFLKKDVFEKKCG